MLGYSNKSVDLSKPVYSSKSQNKVADNYLFTVYAIDSEFQSDR